jgi:hypothetical protein
VGDAPVLPRPDADGFETSFWPSLLISWVTSACRCVGTRIVRLRNPPVADRSLEGAEESTADQRRRAGHAFTSDALEEWPRYSLPALTERMTSQLRSHCEDGHQAWPAKGRYTRHTAEASRRSREDRFAADVAAVRPTEERGRCRPRLGLVDLDTGEIKDL